ncbi:MAG TPA: hypothetical protein DEP42_04580 [Ruminococcaceae bacterium]|nr:hypothetical protein [Oscillospiraceae bacterium]
MKSGIDISITYAENKAISAALDIDAITWWHIQESAEVESLLDLIGQKQREINFIREELGMDIPDRVPSSLLGDPHILVYPGVNIMTNFLNERPNNVSLCITGAMWHYIKESNEFKDVEELVDKAGGERQRWMH